MQFIVSGQRIAVENFVTGKLYTILYKTDTQVNLTCTSIGADCVVFQGESPFNLFTLTMRNADTIDTIEPTQLGTNNYNNLINKPQINGVDLIGNRTSSALGIRDVPAIIEADDGKVLTAASDGSYSWEEIPEGTTDYTDLTNKPQIAGVTLTGNISLDDLGAAAASDIPTTPGDIGAEPAITSNNKLDPSLIDYDSTHAAITEAQVSQIETNKNNISLIKHAANTSIYIQETTPMGAIGDYWLSSINGVKVYGRTAQLIDISQLIVGKSWNLTDNSDRAVVFIPCSPNTTYSLQVNDMVVDLVFVCEKVSIDATTSIDNTGRNISTTTAITFKTTATTACIAVQFNKTSVNASDCQSCNVMLNDGSSIQPYSPYYDWT